MESKLSLFLYKQEQLYFSIILGVKNAFDMKNKKQDHVFGSSVQT